MMPIEPISRPLGHQSYWLVHDRDGVMVGRIVDRTAYEPVQVWNDRPPPTVEGTSPSMLRFEAQPWHAGQFTAGPVFGRLADAHEFLVE